MLCSVVHLYQLKLKYGIFALSTFPLLTNEKSELVKKIKAMGGEHSNDLVVHVNVLIVGDRNSPKYKFSASKRSDIIFIKPSAVTYLHQKWLSGKDIQPDDLKKLTMPIFDDIRVCLGRIDKSSNLTNEDIQHLIGEQGGSVTPHLTAQDSCVVTTEVTGKRCEAAIKWKIPIVHPKWVSDCVKRGALLGMEHYDLTLVDEDKIGEKACFVWDEIDKPPAPSRIKKDVQATRIWDDIMDHAMTTRPLKRGKEDQWEDLQPSPKKVNRPTIQVEPAPISSLFKNLAFQIHDSFSEDQKKTLVKVIKSHEGLIVENDESIIETTFLVVYSKFPVEKIPNFTKGTTVTEWFIERCLHHKKLKFDAWGRPFYKESNKEELNVCITGFQGIELLHVTKLISYLGWNYCEVLNENRDLLIVNIDILKIPRTHKVFESFPDLYEPQTSSMLNINSTKKKIEFVKSHSIPLTSVSFLFQFLLNKGHDVFINDENWCLYCPKNSKSSKFILKGTKSPERRIKGAESFKTSPMRKKNKDWGKIIASTPSLQPEINLPVTTMDTSPDVPDPTQVSYAPDTGGAATRTLQPPNSRSTRRTLQSMKDMF